MSADDEARRITDLVSEVEKEDLYDYSVFELDERIERLEAEIVRVKAARDQKKSGAAAAEAFFKS